MKLQHLLSAIAGLTLVAATATPSFAFMNEGQSVDSKSAGMSSMVESLREEVAAGNTACVDMLNKVNQAVAEIDSRLDAGVADEAGYLDARASLLKLRSDLPCLAEQLTQMQEEMMMEQMPSNAEIISDELLSEETLGGSIVQGGELGSTGYASGMSSGGYATSGGSFGGGGGAGGGLAGGGGLGGLASLGALGAAIAVGASNDNNSPGVVISPSTP